jgi:hypothetical protein
MVRVGGGWDTLAHYLDKHDPCRCSSGTALNYDFLLSLEFVLCTERDPEGK